MKTLRPWGCYEAVKYGICSLTVIWGHQLIIFSASRENIIIVKVKDFVDLVLSRSTKIFFLSSCSFEVSSRWLIIWNLLKKSIILKFQQLKLKYFS